MRGDELRRLLAAIDPEHRLIFETAAETGAPLAETLGIVWREVDLDAETITLSHQLDRHGARCHALDGPADAAQRWGAVMAAPRSRVAVLSVIRRPPLGSGPPRSRGRDAATA